MGIEGIGFKRNIECIGWEHQADNWDMLSAANDRAAIELRIKLLAEEQPKSKLELCLEDLAEEYNKLRSLKSQLEETVNKAAELNREIQRIETIKSCRERLRKLVKEA